MEYQAPDNIYWLFSSSAQAIAAFIGFLTAGFYFVLDKMDGQLSKDSTLEEIHKEIKRLHFNKLKVLCFLTAASIILSLFLVFVNRFDFCLKGFLIVLVSVLNVITILWAIFFIINIIDPDKVNKTAEKLIKENTDYIPSESEESTGSLKIGEFLEKFVKFERLIRELDERYNLTVNLRSKYNEYEPLSSIFRLLVQRNLIDQRTYINLNVVNKVRNLAAHGKIESVDKKIDLLLTEFIEKIERLIKEKK